MSGETLNGIGLPIYSADLGEDKAIPLIRLHKGTFALEQEATDLLRQIALPIIFLCVCGKYRTGKSYLLNKILLNTTKGFAVGSTINACTKGLWLWKRPFKYITEDKEEFVVIVIDTEGLGAIDEDENHDTKIVLLGLLLSSLMIYNSVGSIDENALNSLSLVVNISKTLQASNASDKADEDEFAKNFPSFFWVLRDFSLQLKDPQGNSITSKQYLENALSLQKGGSETIENKNKVRRLLKHFFSDRDCATLVRPTENESDLQNLIQMPDNKLRKEFVDQVAILRTKIRKKLKPKVVNGKKVNGPMLADLCAAYTEAVNKGKVPSIDDAWSNMCKTQCEEALNEAHNIFEQGIKEKIYAKLPLTKKNIKETFEELKESATNLFRSKIINKLSAEEESVLTTLLTKSKKEAKAFISHNTKELCESYFEKICTELANKIKKSQYKNFQDYKDDIRNLLANVPEEIREAPGYESVKAELFLSTVLSNVEALTDKTNNNHSNEVKLLTQRLKSSEAEVLSRKTEALKDKEFYMQKLRDAEEEYMKLKSREILLEERSKSFTSDIERQEGKYRDKIDEYGKRIQELELELKTARISFDRETQAQRDEWVKKDLQTSKDLALKEQQLEFMNEKVERLQKEVEIKDKEIAELTNKLKENKVISNQVNYDQPNVFSTELAMENAVLKKQLEVLQQQMQEHSYSVLMETINKNIYKALQKENNSKPTMIQDRCALLEAKVHRMRKYHYLLSMADKIQCKACGGKYANNLFGAHLKLCQPLRNKDEVLENLPLSDVLPPI